MNYDHAFISLGSKKLRKKRRVTLGGGGGGAILKNRFYKGRLSPKV